LNRAQEELKNQVEQSERKLQEFARNSGLITIGNQNISEEKLRQLQTELASAQVDRIAKQSIYEASQTSPTEALPQVLDSGPMGAYQAKLAGLRQELAMLSTTLTPNHYRIQRVQAQIRELEAASQNERKNVLTRIRIEYEASLKREQQLQRDFNAQTRFLSGQAGNLVQYNILLREVETNRNLYTATLTQGKEASLASAMRANNARVVDFATVTPFPNSPNLTMNMSLGMIGGLFFGALFVVVRSTMDPTVKLPGSLGTQLNLRELGVIPSAGTVRELRSPISLLTGAKSARKSRGPQTILIPKEEKKPTWSGLELVTWTEKSSVISEAFRSVMTSILFSNRNSGPAQVLVVTSSVPQEGKTTVVSNLAIALAEINHRVLLIDADMRLPRLHSIFNLPNTFGLSDFLHERKPIEEYVDGELFRTTHVPNLYVMPAGPARSSLSRLLYSSRMRELMSRVRGSFDTILIDSAPVLSVPDARILAHSADGVVLVVRAHRTHQQSAFAAIRCFEEDGRPIIGTILNDWNPKMASYGPYGAYSYYGAYGASYTAYRPDGTNPYNENRDRR
jgi:capsular exopolysaccharide synthesis family protein